MPTLAQLEAFVSSPAYDAETAGLIALGVPELPRFKGEQIAPGITRIRGNLCNVHGKYGPCDKGLAGKKKPVKGRGRKPAAPKKTDAQRSAERDTKRQQNAQSVAQRMAESDTGLAPQASKNLLAFAQGQQPDAMGGAGLASLGLAERATDGSYRMTPTGHAVVAAMQAGDYQRAVDAISRGTDASGKRQERQTAAQTRQGAASARRQEVATRRQTAAAERAKRQQERAAKKPAKASASGSKKPEQPSVEKPRRAAPAKRVRRNSAPSIGSVASSAPKRKPLAQTAPVKPITPKKPVAPVKQIAPALQESVQALSDGKELSEQDTQSLIRNGLAKLDKNGTLILTTAGMRATQKDHTIARWNGRAWIKNDVVVAEPDQSQFAGHTMEDWDHDLPHKKPSPKAVESARAQFAKALGVETVAQPVRRKETSFTVFKDASGRYRWVAQSSTAFQDRDKEIVSTKALADDCAFADKTGSYGPLRWWHSPGLDLGECDFNAMHGRVLIESGTFKSEAIALKVAQAAPQLEISLGFLHLPTEPDAAGVFHHIRRFERSLVPRGKASNRFTAFTVKELTMLDATKVAALKTLGFSDDDITSLQTQAAATEKSADAQQVAYKADEPVMVMVAPQNASYQPGERFKAANGVDEYIKSPSDLDPTGVYWAMKAFPPSPPTAADVVEEDAIGDMPMEEVPAEGGLTLSPEDLQAIGGAIAEAIGPAIAQVMGALDLEKKVAGHVQGLMAPYQQAQATKDATDADRAEQVAALQTSLKDTQDKLNELLGLQPAVKAERATESTTTTINPWIPQDAQLLQAIKDQVSPNDQFAFGDLVENLFGNQTPGQA